MDGDIAFVVAQDGSFAQRQAQEVRAVVVVDGVADVEGTDTEDEVLSVCFDDPCLKGVDADLSQGLDMVADGVDVVGCVLDQIFPLGEVEVFDVGIVQIWLEP